MCRTEGAPTEVDEPSEDGQNAGSNDRRAKFLDVRMPKLTGLDLQRALIETGRDERVIFITANGNIPMCVRATKAGAANFLSKPFDGAELLAAVKARCSAPNGSRTYCPGNIPMEQKILFDNLASRAQEHPETG